MGAQGTVVLWWQLAPGAVMRMLRVFGFLEFTVYYHMQSYHPDHRMDEPPVEALHYTLVAERHKGWAPRLERTESEVATEQGVRRAWSAPGPAAATADVAALQAELDDQRRSLSWRLTSPVRTVGGLLRRVGLRR